MRLYGPQTGRTFTIDGCEFKRNILDCGTTAIVFTGQDTRGGNYLIANNLFKQRTTGISDSITTATLGTTMIENNIFDRNGTGIYRRLATPATLMTVNHNTFYQCYTTDVYISGAIDCRDETGGDFGPTVTNNLIVGANNAYKDALMSSTTAVTTINADNNGFYNVHGGGDVGYLGSAYRNLAYLNGLTDASGNILGNADPFVDAANNDFHLKAGSWALYGRDGYIGALKPAAEVPEPATLLLMGTGALGVIGYVRRRQLR